MGMHYSLLAITAVVVIFLWRAKTLAEDRYACKFFQADRKIGR